MKTSDTATIELLRRSIYVLDNVDRISSYEIRLLQNEILLQVLYLEKAAKEEQAKLLISKAKQPKYVQVIDSIRKNYKSFKINYLESRSHKWLISLRKKVS